MQPKCSGMIPLIATMDTAKKTITKAITATNLSTPETREMGRMLRASKRW